MTALTLAQEQVALAMTERELAEAVVAAALTFGWMAYRTWLSIRSPKGFPDLVLLRAPRLLFVELKREKTKPTPAQWAWLEALGRVATAQDEELGQPEVYLWKPRDWLSGEIERVLQ